MWHIRRCQTGERESTDEELAIHIIIGVVAAALIVFLLISRGGSSRKAPKIDHTPMSPFERVISSHEFEELVVAHSHRTPVLVDFYADWCGPCHAFSPVLSEMAKHCDGSFLLAKIDFDTNKEPAAKAGVRALPAIALFKDGKRVDGCSGGRLPHSLRFLLAKNGVAGPGGG